MVLTNLQCWANDWDIQSNVENPNLDRNVDLFNPRTVNSNISHISSNGYYGFLNLNNHDINIELNSVENNRVKQLNSYKANEMMALDTPMMDTVEKPSNGENFTKIANGNFPAITNEHTNKNNFSISNGASGGGGFDRKKRSCIDDDEHRTEGVTNAKRVCPNHTWVRQDFQNDAAEPMFISEDCPQQNYEEPMIIEPANNKFSTSTISCQNSNNSRYPKIVGGHEAKKHEMPFIVSLMRRGGHFCGATIINEKWLLTAGHCVCNGLNKILKPSNIRGVIGLHSISQFTKEFNVDENLLKTPYEVEFQQIITHPNYQCTKVQNDIALLELTKPIEFADHIKPACLKLDTSTDNYENMLATVSGWGWTDENLENGDRSDVLRKASVKIWNNHNCEKSYKDNGKKNHFITETQLCAGHENGGIDSCWADSGGPLMTKDNILIGVVSTGIGCARPGLPGIYTRISKYINWMENIINI